MTNEQRMELAAERRMAKAEIERDDGPQLGTRQQMWWPREGGLPDPGPSWPVTNFQPLDRVRVGGRVYIITRLNPTRPANKYSGVLENGHGKEYIFGDKHRPVKVGVAAAGHPALIAAGGRQRAKPDRDTTGIIEVLVNTLLADDPDVKAAVDYAGALRTLGY